MAFFDGEMAAMLDVFLLETHQLLEQLDGILLSAERENRFSKEEIHSIFRIMHTTKGSAAMMGLTYLSELTHKLEDLFAVFREDARRMQGLEKETFGLLFDASDFIKAEMERMRGADYEPLQGTEMLQRIAALIARTDSKERVSVRLTFEKDCKMENVRAYMAARQIRHLCSDVQTYPRDVEKNPQTAEFIRREGFYIRFVSADKAAVLRQLQGALFVDMCQIVDDIPSEQSAQAPESLPAQGAGNYISVRVEKLDALQNLTGELMILAADLASEEEVRHGPRSDGFDLYASRILKELESLVMSIRLVPFGNLESKLRRVVRDMCMKEKKEVSFSVKGQQVEVDKTIIDNIFEPLMHLLRNAIDHGIEPPQEREAAGKKRDGQVCVRIENLSGEIRIEVSDDGRGMDTQKILEKARRKGLLDRPAGEYTTEQVLEFCFQPGFSTQENATEYSGRGVGLDVVHRSVEQLGGHLSVNSEREKGTRFILHMPLSLTLIDSFLLNVGPCVFAIPAYQAIQFYAYDDASECLKEQGGRGLWVADEKCLPLIRTAAFYGLPPADAKGAIVIAVRGATREACLLVDGVRGKQSVVSKALPGLFGPRFKQCMGIAGASILGDGGICMLLDPEDLIRAALERGQA